jgi:hypothetical protein
MSRGQKIEQLLRKSRFFWLSWVVFGASCAGFSSEKQGEFGGNLGFLRSFYLAPQIQGESNHYIDLWEGQKLRAIISINGLTNNHTLFVNSHGKGMSGGRFAFYPHQSLGWPGGEAPCYSAADLAAIVGEAHIQNIHNIVLAACNAEGTLSATDLRRCFPNATNIVHSARGELGYQAMFLQAIVNNSWNIKPVYEWCERNGQGQFEYITGLTPPPGAKRFAPYVAEIFRSGANDPFQVQRAGRELLDPERRRILTSTR